MRSPRVIRRALISLVVACALMPAAAGAAPYTPMANGCSSWGSGQSDETGTTWYACNASIAKQTPDGARIGQALPAGTAVASVAPSPDGRMLYIASSATRSIRRYVPGATANSWVLDPSFVPAQFLYAGRPTTLCTNYVATDAFGDVYTTNGGWCAAGSPVRVLKYGADGRIKAAFGESEVTNREQGKFKVAMGLSVSRDGRRVVVADQTNSRIHEFRYQLDGTYQWNRTLDAWAGNPVLGNRTYLAAPYDVKLDQWGRMYVADTTAQRIVMFDQDLRPVRTVVSLEGTGVAARPHALTVMANGDVHVPEFGTTYVRNAAELPLPGPIPVVQPLPVADTVAPVITDLAVPSITDARAITATLVADDQGGSGPAKVRLANEDGVWSAWRPYATSLVWTLSGGLGAKGVSVEVADAAGNVSVQQYRTTRLVASLDVTAPVVASVEIAPGVTIARDVTIVVSATDDHVTGVTSIRLANEDGVWSAWRTHAPAVAWTLTDGLGIKHVSVQVRDAAGNVSTSAGASVRRVATLDTSAPVVAALSIPSPTTGQQVGVSTRATDEIGGTGVTSMRLANEDGIYGAWRDFAAVTPWTVSHGAGAKRIFVQVRDGAGNTSQALALGITVTYPKIGVQPVITSTPVKNPIAAGSGGAAGPTTTPIVRTVAIARSVRTRSVIVTTKVLSSSKVVSIRLRNERGGWSGWKRYGPKLRWTLTAGTGAKSVQVQVRNASGGISAVKVAKTRLR